MLGIGEYILLLIILFFIISTLFTKFVAVGLIVIVTSLTFWKLNEYSNYWKKRNIPSPKGKLGIGNIIELFENFKNSDERWKKKFGKTYGLMMGLTPDITTTDLNIIKEVYVKQFEKFIDRETFFPGSNKKEKSLFAHGMFMLRGDDWRRVRNLSSPAFTTGKMKMFVTFFNETANKTLELLKNYELEDKPIDIKKMCDGMTLDSIFKSTFGLKTDLQEDPNNIVRKNAKKVFDANVYDPRVYFNYHIKDDKEIKFFTDLLSQCYEKRKKELKEVNDDDDNKEKDEDIMFENATKSQKAKGMSKIEILAQGFLFLLAGYETTASTINFLLFMLANHQEYQEKCREEILDALQGKDINYIDYDTVNKLNYLDQCVKECLRMFPPAGKINRICVEKTTINGIEFEPGTMVSVPIFNLHYDEEIYPQPNIFDPERFSTEQKAGRDPLYYMPFGYGPRNCIGMRFAYLSIKIYIARFLTKYRFKTCKESVPLPLEIATVSLTKPKDTLYLKVETISNL
ncbi:Cytochrome P450 family and Cytochrome P450, E-class, group I family-containing protein [Strongyloides ratti]|uniref:Cytochrome P450 family and Cytochrome P450, E-class, group I family-containing protein n=1 Tax=Strongyloides ratti TaxID=34506 RepID=A0A090MZT7_STRRB|nr:Cytochrome P450 family and Cytochrome P450, E-class, group I family-containing protein [Strongyloides ratti]CEF69504.1 Cytochrome P450 family and Cytochrome P450, E-class, group I family-containing protein [Strongyloides ratti]